MAEERTRRGRGMAFLAIGLTVWVAALIAGIVVVAVRGAGPARFDTFWDEVHVLGSGAKVAMVEITGEIVPGHGTAAFVGGRSFGADDYVSQLRQAEEDDSVAAVIVRLDTPGGAVVASDEIYQMVRRLRAKKPVIALMEDVAASGGYYVGAGANRIVAGPATITGSIGVIAFFPNLEGTAQKLGVKPVVIKSGRFKDIGSPFRDMTAQERALLQRSVDQAYAQFVGAIASGRDMDATRVRALADGRIFSGTDAKANGLIDEIGGIDQAVGAAAGAAHISGGVEVVRYVAPRLGFGDLLGRGAVAKLGLGDLVRQATDDALGLPSRAGLAYLWLG